MLFLFSNNQKHNFHHIPFESPASSIAGISCLDNSHTWLSIFWQYIPLLRSTYSYDPLAFQRDTFLFILIYFFFFITFYNLNIFSHYIFRKTCRKIRPPIILKGCQQVLSRPMYFPPIMEVYFSPYVFIVCLIPLISCKKIADCVYWSIQVSRSCR